MWWCKMKKIMNNIKGIYHQVTGKMYDFYVVKIYPVSKKIKDKLTHNFVICFTSTHLVLFKILRVKITTRRREAVIGYLFILLWLIGYLIFTFYPIFYSLYLSFQTAYFNIGTGFSISVAGLKNYLSVLSDARLLPLFVTYLGKIMLSVPLIIIFAIIIAILINQPIKGKGLFRSIFFLPVIIATGPVIGELVAQSATSLPSLSRSSVASSILSNLPAFVANPIVTLFNSMLLVLWYAGIPILVFLAGLQKIDKSIYEAAEVDGASPWDTFWKITLPSIYPLINVNIIYVVVSMSLYVESGGILDLARIHMIQGSSTSTLWLGYGYASAIAWVYFFLMVLVILIFIGLFGIVFLVQLRTRRGKRL